MNKADCFHLGNVARLHGFKGEVSLFFDVTNPSDYEGLDAVFIEINNQLTPFFVEKLRMTPKGFAVVKFEGVDSENDARLLLRKKLYLPAQVLQDLGDKEFYDHEVVGFEVIDQDFGSIGILEQVIDLKANPLLQVVKDEKEILIPISNNVVQKVDRKNKQLHIQAPPGLIELYLG